MSIAEKLETVAENQQKVFEAGKISVCPRIDDSGIAVACYPLEGYPLTVATEEGATKISQYGKNLLTSTAESKTTGGVTFTVNSDGSITANGTATAEIHYDVGKANVKIGQSYTLNGGAAGGGQSKYALYVAHESVYYYDYNGNGVTFTAVANKNNTYRIFVKKGITLNNAVFKPMVRVASVASAEYVPYQAPLSYAPGDVVSPLPGVNTIYANTGEVTITGVADPVAIIEELTSAIVSYGGNV